MSLAVIVLIASLLAAPGLRLLRSSYADRREPELWLGFSFFLVGLGLGLRLYAALPVATGEIEGYAAQNLAGHAAITVGTLCLYVFTWRVFHATNRVVGCIVGVMGVALVADLVWIVQGGGYLVEQHPSVVLANVLRGAVLPWVFAESLRYRSMMRRRVALGIGDPVVANRFTLWAIWSGALSVLPIFVLAARVATGQVGDGTAQAGTLKIVLPIIRIIALSGVSCALVCIWLSFFPPKAYLAKLRREPAAA